MNHYDILFSELTTKFGDIDTDTVTSIIGFSAGGPVSICTISENVICVTCELSEYAEQIESTDGLKYEFFAKNLEVDTCRTLFTALGNLSMNCELGDLHTIDVEMLGIKKHHRFS